MAKKVTSFILLICCFSMLSGCEKVKDLTDEETRLIAEYAADSLLKYDLTYTDRIAEGENEASEMSETEDITENSEEAPTEEATTEVTTEDKSSKGQHIDNAIDEESSEEEVQSESIQDIATVVGADGLSVTYKDYLISKQYPSQNKEGELIYLDASDGYELLVVRFQVKNLSEESVNVSFLDKEISYKLICNDNKAATPMLTILLNDLTTFEALLSPSEETEAVLVFQIAENMKDAIQTIDLQVSYNDTNSKIHILR